MVPLEGDFVDVALQMVFAYRVMCSVHLAFDCLEAVDLPLDRAVAPRRRDG